jgi:malonate-semialdehyde dehydrogenase (acetylating)/methylmalonate-semialdehyde dehydrogenase
VVSKLPLTTPDEFNAAVAAAKAAFPGWRDTPVSTRARVMLKFQHLIRENWVRTCPNRCCVGRSGQQTTTPIATPRNIYPLPRVPFTTQDDLAKLVTQEQGKTFLDARGDVFRGLGELWDRAQGHSREHRAWEDAWLTLFNTFRKKDL